MNSAARRKAKKKEDGVRRGSLTGHNGQTLFFSPSPRLPDIGHKALCPISYVDIRHACDTWVDVDSIRVLYLAPRYDTIRYDTYRGEFVRSLGRRCPAQCDRTMNSLAFANHLQHVGLPSIRQGLSCGRQRPRDHCASAIACRWLTTFALAGFDATFSFSYMSKLLSSSPLCA